MTDSAQVGFELICVIVNYGTGSKVLRTAKAQGISGGTIFYGTGTAKSRFLKFLELGEQKKEMIVMIAQKPVSREFEQICSELKLDKPNHGIAFTVDVPVFLGGGDYNYRKIQDSNGGETMTDEKKYNSIFTIVDKGKGETVMETATENGAKGGTVLNARGSGIHETARLFNMQIEPEKEMVLILSERNLTEAIATAIRDKLEIDKPGNGIIFILDVNKTYGIA